MKSDVLGAKKCSKEVGGCKRRLPCDEPCFHFAHVQVSVAFRWRAAGLEGRSTVIVTMDGICWIGNHVDRQVNLNWQMSGEIKSLRAWVLCTWWF